jgi:hypothetical protein
MTDPGHVWAPDLDPETDLTEAIAAWLESAARHGQPWALRRLAAALRDGSWRTDPPIRTDRAILLARADDHIARGGRIADLPGPELAAVMDREGRRDRQARQQQRRADRLGEQVTEYLRQQHPTEKDTQPDE